MVFRGAKQPQLSDGEIVELLKSHDKADVARGMEAFVGKYEPLFDAMAKSGWGSIRLENKMDREDATIETFMAILKNIAKPSFEYRSDKEFRGYLFRTLKSKCIDLLRGWSREKETDYLEELHPEDLRLATDPRMNPERVMERKIEEANKAEAIQKALNLFEEDSNIQEVLKDMLLERSRKETAIRLKIKESTVSNYRSEIRKTLKQKGEEGYFGVHSFEEFG